MKVVYIADCRTFFFLVLYFIIAKLSLNFNYNLVESWDGYILNFPSNPATTTHLEKYGMTSASTANFDYNYNFNYNF